MGFFSKPTFGDVKAYLEKGALVLDVRTVAEYESGHVKGSKNIVLDTLPNYIEEIKAFDKPIITCCKSGGRSGSAKDFLEHQGLDVINGGPWQNVDQFVKE